MKLRIKGDSLRLRLSRTDVQRLAETGAVEETAHFPGGALLRYAVEMHASDAPLHAELTTTRIVITLPARDVHAWAESELVGLYGEIAVPGGTLAVAVEKDFACIDRNDPEDADAFPNPKGAVC